MNFALKPLQHAVLCKDKADALLVVIDSRFEPDNSVLSGLVAQAFELGDLQPKAGEALTLHRPASLACRRLVLLHVGDGGPADLRKALTGAVTAVKASRPERLSLCFWNAPEGLALRVALTTLADASYVYTTTKSKAETRSIQRLTVWTPQASDLQHAFELSVAAVEGIELAKEWANRPGNHCTPTLLAKAAKDLAKHAQLQCEVLGAKELEKLGMGAFLAVARGSEEPPRLIVLQYHGAPKSVEPVALIGKGITFDSGGISIKPAAEMDEMKFDMCGAASVLGAFRALADLKPRINVVGVIPACENLPSGRAVKPGDVVTSLSGQTIEILNTDAEGRLILCDALTFAQRFKPRAIIDIATLTGACVIALGGVRSGLFCTDPQLATTLMQAGESSQDLCWPMPLDEEYAEALKSNFADVANVGGRPAGAVTAAKFLQKFAEGRPWAHLDIAGTAWKGGTAKGATGRPVGLLLDTLMALELKD